MNSLILSHLAYSSFQGTRIIDDILFQSALLKKVHLQVIGIFIYIYFVDLMEIKWQVHTHPCNYKFSDKCILDGSLGLLSPPTRPPQITSRLFTGKPQTSAASPALFLLGSTKTAITIPSNAVSTTKKILLC